MGESSSCAIVCPVNSSAFKDYRVDRDILARPTPSQVIEPSAAARRRTRVSTPMRGAAGDATSNTPLSAAQLSWKAALVNEHLGTVAESAEDRRSPLSALAGPRDSRTRLRCAVDDDGRLEPFESSFCTTWWPWTRAGLRTRSLPGRSPRGGKAPKRLNCARSARANLTRSFVARHPPSTMHELCSLRGEPLEPSTQSRVKVDGHVYSVSPRAFWQSHRDAPALLVQAVSDFADVQSGDHVVDLFSGVGLFSVPLARAAGPGGRVTAVESSAYAVRDARQNAEGLGLRQGSRMERCRLERSTTP